MNAFLTFRLSNNLGKTPEGYLIARSVPVSRTATLQPLLYRERELGIANSDNQVRVWRPAATLFDPRSLASLEGKPVVSPHPSRFLTAADTAAYIKGHIQNVRPATELLDNGERALLADLVIFDPLLIQGIKDRSTREVSLGYDAEYVPAGEDWEQVSLTYNHCALVPVGRAGQLVAVQDSEGEMTTKDIADRVDRLIEILSCALGSESRHVTPKAKVTDKRSLIDEIEAIRASARRTEELVASGCGPGEFHQELAKRNPSYREYDARTTAGQAFADEAKAAGLKMQEQALAFYRPERTCRQPITSTTDNEQAWADQVNAHGARLRGGK